MGKNGNIDVGLQMIHVSAGHRTGFDPTNLSNFLNIITGSMCRNSFTSCCR